MTTRSPRQRPSRLAILGMIALGSVLAVLLWSLNAADYRHELAAGVLAGTLLAACSSKVLSERWRNALLSAGVVVFMLGAAETYLTSTNPSAKSRNVEQTFSGTLSQTHTTLGYAPPTSTQVRVTRTVAKNPGDIIYDVTYSLDDHARRTVPEVQTGNDCVLFFGGSFTWGEGVEDHQTIPRQFSVASGLAVNAVNFGYAGYGPNHMLRAIEDGILSSACDSQIRAVFYTAIPVHYLRSAGLVDWGPKSPRYVFNENAEAIRFAGPLYADMQDFVDFQRRRQSALIIEVWNLAKRPSALSVNSAIVREAASRIEAELGGPFVILYWDLIESGRDPQLTTLKESGFSTFLVSELLTRDQMTNLRIPGDGHPNAEAYKLLGHALYKRLTPTP